MTKSQEIEILHATITKLGPDSYLGPWLFSVAGEVERSIRSDFFPDCSIKDTIAKCNELVADATRTAKDKLDAAQKESDRLRQRTRSELGAALQNAIEKLQTMHPH